MQHFHNGPSAQVSEPARPQAQNKRGPDHLIGAALSSQRSGRSAWTATVAVVLHVANVDELAARAKQLNAVELYVNQVGVLPRLAAVPHSQLDLDAVLRGAGHNTRVGIQYGIRQRVRRDRTIRESISDVVIHAVRLDVELVLDALVRVETTSVTADDHLLTA